MLYSNVRGEIIFLLVSSRRASGEKLPPRAHGTDRRRYRAIKAVCRTNIAKSRPSTTRRPIVSRDNTTGVQSGKRLRADIPDAKDKTLNGNRNANTIDRSGKTR